MTRSTRPGGKQVAGLARALGGVDEARRDDLGAELCEARLDIALVAQEALVQALELRPVGRQADAEEPDPRALALSGEPASRRTAPRRGQPPARAPRGRAREARARAL